MANIRSAKKRARQSVKRAARNLSRMRRARTFVRRAEEALAGDDKTKAAEAFLNAQSELARAASRGVITKNAASRKTSRLNARLKAMS